MKSSLKTILRTAFTALLLPAFMQAASAAIVTNIVENGNYVYDYGSTAGTSDLYVEFYNQDSIQIDFDNPDFASDSLYIEIWNDTWTGWSAFEFKFIDASIASAITITALSGVLTAIDFSDVDPATGYSRIALLSFDPLEEVGLLDGQGIIDTSVSSTYSLIITPTAVPVPAAVWLFGSGLLGLAGMIKRKK